MKNSDLKKLLEQADEQVAVPRDFRAKLMQRLAEQGLHDAPAAPARASLLERVWASLTPRLALAGAAAAVLALVFLVPSGKDGKPELRWPATANTQAGSKQALEVQARVRPSQVQARVKPSQEKGKATSQAQAGLPREQKRSAQLAHASKSQPASSQAALAQPAPAQDPQVAQAPEGAWQSFETEVRERASQSAPIQGNASAGEATAASAPLASIAAQKPLEIVIKPTSTPLSSPVRARSEVRQNVARLARGEQVLIYVNLPAPGKVKIEVYDRLGRRVCVLKDDPFPAGVSETRWGGHLDNGALAAAGIYQVLIQAPGFEDRHKIALVK